MSVVSCQIRDKLSQEAWNTRHLINEFCNLCDGLLYHFVQFSLSTNDNSGNTAWARSHTLISLRSHKSHYRRHKLSEPESASFVFIVFTFLTFEMRVVSETVADITVDSDEFPVKHQTVFQEDNKTSKLGVNFLLSPRCLRYNRSICFRKYLFPRKMMMKGRY